MSAAVPAPFGWILVAFLVFGTGVVSASLPAEVRAAGGLLQVLRDARVGLCANGVGAFALGMLAVRQLVLVLGTQLVDVAAGRALVEVRLGPLCWRRTFPLALARRADIRPALFAPRGSRTRGSRMGAAAEPTWHVAELDLREGGTITLLRHLDVRRRGVAEHLVDRINEEIADTRPPTTAEPIVDDPNSKQ